MLEKIADIYRRSMGPMRYVVLITARGPIRTKYRFVTEESRWLKRFASSLRQELEQTGDDAMNATFTIRSAVAFWGRIFAGTQSKRARRRLSERDLEVRETLGHKFEKTLRPLVPGHRALIEKELAIRRPREAAWMRENLSLGPGSGE